MKDTSNDFTLVTFAEGNQNRYFYNLFAQYYNEASKSTHPVQALSLLSQIKEDIKHERSIIYDRMLYVKEKIEELTSLFETGKNTRVNYFVITAHSMVSYLLRGGYKIYDSNQFIVDEEELKEFRKLVIAKGLSPTNVIDRHVFKSVYFQTPGGVLFEMATDGPGYHAVASSEEEMGEELFLPDFLEPKRDEIEEILEPIEVDPTQPVL